MDQYAGRKATARIRVVDEKGNAVKNTEFQAELKNHEFLFGCGAFDAIPLTNEKRKMRSMRSAWANGWSCIITGLCLFTGADMRKGKMNRRLKAA